MDIWTCPTGNRSYLGIVANWCDVDFEIQNSLITLPVIEGQHTGANIAQVAFDIMEDYKISEKSGYFMLDNVTNHDTAVASFHSLLVNKYGLEAAPISPTEH